MSCKDNYLSYDDSDSMTDYFHGYSLGINRAVEWIKKDGGREIRVTVTNNDQNTPAFKRVQQIIKACGYIAEDKSHNHTYYGYNNEPYQVFVYEWLLKATPERIKVLDAEDAEEQRKQLEAEAYRKTPQAQLARLKGELVQAQNVTAVFDARGFHLITDTERKAQIEAIEAEIGKVLQEVT